MNTLSERTRDGAFLLSEGNGAISRERITLAAGPLLPAGQLLAVEGGKYVPYSDPQQAPAVAILFAAVSASEQDREGAAIVRLAEVKHTELRGIDTAVTASLAQAMIFIR